MQQNQIDKIGVSLRRMPAPYRGSSEEVLVKHVFTGETREYDPSDYHLKSPYDLTRTLAPFQEVGDCYQGLRFMSTLWAIPEDPRPALCVFMDLEVKTTGETVTYMRTQQQNNLIVCMKPDGSVVRLKYEDVWFKPSSLKLPGEVEFAKETWRVVDRAGTAVAIHNGRNTTVVHESYLKFEE